MGVKVTVKKNYYFGWISGSILRAMNYDRKGRLFPSSFLFFFLPRYTWPQYDGVTRISSMYHFPAVHFSWHTWEHASSFRSQIFVKISKPSTLFFNPLDMEYLHFRNFLILFNRVLIQFNLYNINFNDTLGKNIIIHLKNCYFINWRFCSKSSADLF